MKKLNVKKTMLVVALMAIVCVISNVSYATGNIDDLLREMESQAGNITVIEDTKPEEPTTNQTEVPTTTTTPTENKVEKTNTNTALPKTGVDDTMLWVLIAVSVVAAGYTYKKVRDYNV